MKRIVLATLIIIVLSQLCFSQQLKRRAYLGIRVKNINDSISQKYKISQGVYIDTLIDITRVKTNNLLTGDIILGINDSGIINVKQFINIVSSKREGDKADFDILRNGKKKKLIIVFPPYPYETSETTEIIYDNFTFNAGLIRVIVDKPKQVLLKEEKLPAILFIQGYTCGSLDNIDDMHPYIQLIKRLCEKGYVVMRIEKPGDGDCYNTPACEDIDFHTEVDVFEEGLNKLKSFNFVDTAKVFIWGHSMGGIIAPIIASRNSLKGIIVYGTVIEPWREYLVEMFRVQNPLFGVDPVENENNMINYYRIIHSLFIDKKKPAEIAEDTVLLRLLTDKMEYDENNRIFSRNYKYLVQIDDYNLTEAWSKTNAYVLSMWGDADIEAFSRYSQETIVDVVNHYHPGKAEFMVMKGTTHSFAKVESLKDGIKNYNWQYITENFNNDVVEKTDQWINKILAE